MTKNHCDVVLSEESYSYDAAGNITDAPNSCFAYDTNNRLITFNGNTVSYDLDGNMLSNGTQSYTYDSANRLITAGGHIYTYDASDVRIKDLCNGVETRYIYNTNCKLSQLLTKVTGGTMTKYVYGHGLIGEETNDNFKTYHFDFRGSTVAITNECGNITDTFAYDTYGKLISRTGTSKVIFGYNGRDGVVTDDNGLIYMRARYYSPNMRRFINADVVPGEISNAITLNRFAYANGNPVSYIDPFGLMPAWAKFLAGGLIIAGLAVATVATGGVAGAIVGAALVGASISGGASVVSGIVAGNSADEIATSFLVGTISGAASGALVASGVGSVGMVGIGAAIDAGEVILEDSINGELSSDTYIDAAISAGVGIALDGLSNIKIGKASKHGKITLSHKNEDGWHHKKGELYSYYSDVKVIDQEYGNRTNRDYYNKVSSQAKQSYDTAIKNKRTEYFFSSCYSAVIGNYIDSSLEGWTKDMINNFGRK